MFVYFMQEITGGPVKIGFSKDPAKRLRSAQSGNPTPLRLVAIAHGSRAAERLLHRAFSDLQIEGTEWFRNEEPLKSLLARLPGWHEKLDHSTIPTVVALHDCYDILKAVGYSYQEIGDYFGMSKQRVHQLIDPGSQNRRKREELFMEDRPSVADYIQSNPGLFKSSIEIRVEG